MPRLNELEAALPRGRTDLAETLAGTFPASVRATPAFRDSQAPADALLARDALTGGRRAALERLARIDPVAYARTRNHTGGAVTMLSPWIRHGALGLAEVRDHALERVRTPEDAQKLVTELGWRDYWQQVYATLGTGIFNDIERPAVAWRRAGPLDRVPDDVLAGRTGLACIDAFVETLHRTGWLHNHERMWLASWLVHVRGVRWRAGADWFLEHLVDGDPASNHLSWQWVAGTFSAKPYIFNRENLETFTAGAHCRGCAVLGRCDVEGSYDDLAARLFVPPPHPQREPLRIPPAPPWRQNADSRQPSRPLVWVTLDSLAATSPAAAGWPEAPRVFAFDPEWLAAERPTLKRLTFIAECLAEIPGVEIHAGDPVDVLRERAASLGCDGIAVADTPCPLVRREADALARLLPICVARWPAFCRRDRVRDLGRFSRYWSQVGESALRPTERQT